MKFRPIIIILFISLLGSFQVNAAVKWNGSKSGKIRHVDISSLNSKDVPEGFPHFSMNVGETCNDSNKRKWYSSLDFFYSPGNGEVDGLIWSKNTRGNIRLYEGRETKKGKGPAYIKVSYASKRHNTSNWISYKFPKDVDFFEALKNGVKGQRISGSYKLTCIIKMQDYGLVEINTPQKRETLYLFWQILRIMS